MSRVLEQPLEPAPPRADVSAEGPGARQRVVAKRRRRPSGEPPPLPRNLRSTGKYWLGLSGVVLIGWMVTLASDPIKEALTRADIEVLQALGSMRNGFFTSLAKAFHALGSEWTIALLRWGAIIVLLAFKRFRHLFVFLGATLAVGWVTTTVAHAALRARPLEIDIIGSWEGSAHPSRPVAALAVSLVAIVYSLVVPGSPRMWAKWIAGFFIVALCGARLYLGVDHPSDVIVGGILGVALPLVAFRSLAPNEVFPVSYRRKRAAHLDVDGPRGDAIRLAVEEQLGVSITDVRPVGLAGSGGSTPLRLLVSGEPPQELFAKLYAHTHLRADRWYKVGRALLYGRLEDEASFSTVRRLVQYEDYMLRFMRDAGLPTPTPFGFVEITPEREYLLVTDFVPRAKELLEAEVDDHIIDECLALSRALWDAGVAHRDIKPSNLL
ncbi:MAG TPA: phosphatase PAP2 family protein, partial [Actinomycetota bacterium]|nr:phosphatase PAP2 family protein [Actinomycetota bacterium]